MRKILYVLCLLTPLVACSDDDDKIITDYDKPYSKLPTSELRTLIEDNINSCITLVEEFAEMEENNSILDIMNYYGINFYFDISDFMNSRSSDQSKENTFTGMKLVWNKNKQDFDTTINAAGFMEAFFPSSKTDQSNNDLHFIATIDYSTGVYLKIEVSNGKEVLLHKAQQYNKETSEAIQTVKCPPYSATIKMEINDDDIISRFIMRRMPKEITLQKEGGDHYYISLNEENGNLHWVTDFNNIRIRTTIGQYKNIQPLIEEIHYTNEGRYNELATELIQKNMHESVIVFTDKDEKIGEWEFVNLMRNEENPFPLCKCTFQDGTELPFTLYMLLYLK